MQRPTSFLPAQLADLCQQSVHSNIIVCFKETEDATEGSDNVHAVEERVAPDSSHQFLTMKALTSLLVISKLYKCLAAEGHRNKKAIFVFLLSSAEEITHYATYFERNDLHQIHCVRATSNEYSTEKDWNDALYSNSNAPVVLFATFRLFLNAMVCGYINSKAIRLLIIDHVQSIFKPTSIIRKLLANFFLNQIHRGYTRLLSLSDSSNLFDYSTSACRHLQQSLFSTLVNLDINTKSIEPRGFISVVSAFNHSSTPLYEYLLNHHFHLLRSLHGPDVFSISKMVLDELGVSAELQYLRNVVRSVHDHIMPEKASPFQTQISRMKENADKIILPCDGLNNESLYSSKILKLCEFITDMLPSKIDSVVCVVGSREIEPFLLMAIQTLLLEASILMELSVLEQPSGFSVIRLKNADSTEFLEMSVVSVSALQRLTLKSSDCIIWFSPSFAFEKFSALSSVRTQYMLFVDGVRPEVSDAAISIVDTNLSTMTDIPISFKSNLRKVFLSPEVTLNLLSKYFRSLFRSSDCDVILEFYIETWKYSIGSAIERQICIYKSGVEETSTPSAQSGNQPSTPNLHKSNLQRPFPEKRILKSRKNNDERTISLTSIFTSVLPSTTSSNEHPWYRCILLLPPKFPLSQTEFVGQWCLDSQSAKEDVTFQACVDLCRKGLANDKFLPVPAALKRTDPKTQNQVQLSSRNKMYTLLAAPPLRCKRSASDVFPLYITGFVSQGKDTSCFQNVAVLTKLPIPFDVIPRVVVIPDDMPRSFEITPFPSFPLCLQKEQMELLTKFHQEIANRGFNLNLTKEEKTEMPDLFILAPILESVSNIKIPTNDTIDWEMVEAFCNIQDGTIDSGYWTSLSPRIQNQLIFIDRLGKYKRYRMEKIVSITELSPDAMIHGGKVHRANIPPDVTTVIEASFQDPVSIITNEMQGSSTSANGSSQTLNSNSKSRLIYLIPKYPFSVIHNVPADFSMAFSYLPILLYRLDISLLHFQLLQTLNIPVKLETITGCLSAPVANLPVNYEALEFVGDAILYYFLSLVLFQRHPTQHEGFLSRERTRLLDNAFLYNLALEHDIHQYIISTRFSMKSFRTWLLKGEQLQSLPDKMLADVMEAMMAGCYVDGGIRASFQYFQLFWKDHASRFGYDTLVAENAKLYRNKQSSSLVKRNIDISGLEDIIEYRFKNREIGYEAITVSATPNYQRLEWLGDAVLQILITEYIYLNFPNLTAGEMSILRQVGANNSFLGMIVVRLGIHRYLYPLNDPLVFAFEKRLNMLFNELDEEQTMIDGIWEKLDAPKILGDVFESILGAIFIDSGGSLEIARDWFQRVFNPYMFKYINPENVQLHPVKVLRELVQGQRCSGLNITDRPLRIPGTRSTERIYYSQVHLHGRMISEGQSSKPVNSKSMAAANANLILQRYVQNETVHKFWTEIGCDCAERVKWLSGLREKERRRNEISEDGEGNVIMDVEVDATVEMITTLQKELALEEGELRIAERELEEGEIDELEDL